MAVKTIATLVSNMTSSVPTVNKSYDGQVYSDHLLDHLGEKLAQLSSHVVTPDTSLVFSDGASEIITEYEIDMTTGTVMVGGVTGVIAALNDSDLVGAGTAPICYDLDGTTMTVLSADGKSYIVRYVAILVSGAVEIRGVVGAEADDGEEVAPTVAQIKSCLDAASITGYDNNFGVIFGETLIQRAATDSMTLTHTSPATDNTLAQQRALGSIGVIVT